MRFRYEVVRATDELRLCEGETVHIVGGRDIKKRDMPPKYGAKFAEFLKHKS